MKIIETISNFFKKRNEQERQNKIRMGFTDNVYKKGTLTATMALNLTRYGMLTEDISEIIQQKIEDIENQIISKSKLSIYENVLMVTIPYEFTDVYMKVKEHFDSQSFKTLVRKEKQLDEVVTYLYIYWGKGGFKLDDEILEK